MDNTKEFGKENVHAKATRVGEAAYFENLSIPALEAYKIQKEIGRGGMAIVYEAIEKSLNRTVALKVLSKEFSQDEDLIRRFVNEAQAAARLSHPNIVQIYSIGQEKGIYYFAMEYVRGESVENILFRKRKISVLQSIDIMKQTVLALREAYKNNIVHRDIKPGNLLMNEQGIVKVADFGLAAEVRGALVEKGGRLIGTPLYMSPEQAQGKKSDFRSDIYSLGVTFYQMLSGEPPFMATDTRILMKKHIEAALPQLPAEVPAIIKRLIGRMTDKDPEKRFPNYESLLKELDKAYKKLTPKNYAVRITSFVLAIGIGVAVYNLYYKPAKRKLPELRKYDLVKERYEGVQKKAKLNPEQYKYLIKEYANIIVEYPNTEFALRSEEAIDKIIQNAVDGYSEELNQLDLIQNDFIAKYQYQKLIDMYQAVKKRYKDTLGESIAQETIDLITDKAKENFEFREKMLEDYLLSHKYVEARRLYEEAANNYGMDKFIKAANDRIGLINTKEQEYKIKSEAKNIFKPVHNKVTELIIKRRYDEANQVIKSANKVKENPLLGELINKELVRVDGIQLENATTSIKQKMDNQFDIFMDVIKKSEDLISEYKYTEALAAVKEGIKKIEALGWRKQLEAIHEKLQYLNLFKRNVINGINKELADKKTTNISTNENVLIFIVEGGYVAIPWQESSPLKIYQAAQLYSKNNVESHMALGVFCLTYGLSYKNEGLFDDAREILNDARREFTLVLRKDPQMKDVVEKYLTQLAEADKPSSE